MAVMNSSEKIAAIHESVSRGFFVVTGGGSAVLSRLLAVPGASRTVLEAVIPYSPDAMTEFMRQRPEQFCCEPTARRIASMAWSRARNCLSPKCENVPESVFGFALTATLATNREHRGAHRAYAAFQSRSRTISYALELPKGQLDRAAEEELTANWALELIAEFCGVEPAAHTPVQSFEAPAGWQKVLTGQIPFLEIRRSERTPQTFSESFSETLSPQTRGLFSGSFAPIHAGHCEMHACAERILGGEVALELAIRNADKPPLDFVTIRDRLQRIFAAPNFSGKSVLLTGLPYFESKAEHFPHQTFVTGIDTLERIADAKYHFSEPLLLEKSLRNLAALGTRFLVFGRLEKTFDGERFETFQPEKFPPVLAALCQGVPEAEFRSDLSSTAIRAIEQKTEVG